MDRSTDTQTSVHADLSICIGLCTRISPDIKAPPSEGLLPTFSEGCRLILQRLVVLVELVELGLVALGDGAHVLLPARRLRELSLCLLDEGGIGRELEPGFG